MMVSSLKRRMCFGRPLLIYPESYLFGGTLYIHRKADGSFHTYGSLEGPPFYQERPSYADLGMGTLGNYIITYDNDTRRASILAQTVGGGGTENIVLHVSHQRLDNPLEVVAWNGTVNQTRGYSRVYRTATYEAEYPSSAANGDALRLHFQMSASINGHSTLNDIYTFPNGNLFDLDFLVGKSVCGREKVVSAYWRGPYTRIEGTEVLTGWVEAYQARRLRSVTQRIIVEQVATAGNVWTWTVLPYDGSLANGSYWRAANGSISSSGTSANPRIVLATLTRPVSTIGERMLNSYHSLVRYVGFGGDTVRACADVEGDASFGLRPITGYNIDIGRDDSMTNVDPIWSLYGGVLRINHKWQFSINGGPWFGNAGTLNDRWARATTLTQAQIDAMHPLVEP